MTEDEGAGAPRRRALALHLEELRRDGVWGLAVGNADGRRPRVERPAEDPERAAQAEEAQRVSETVPAGSAEETPEMPDAAPAHEDTGTTRSAAARRPRMPEDDPATTPGAADAGAKPGARTTRIRREPDLFDAAGEALTGSEESLEEIRPEVEGCTLCRLCESRTNVVFGVGDPGADLMFIGEGPGRDEDLQGEPFVGRAGKLLDKIIAAMGRRRDDVYIANTVKCRPPQNRNPRDDELASCLPYLERQVAVIRPRVIVLLGRVAVQAVLGLDAPLSRLRGAFQTWRGADVMCTYHPAYLLRNPSAKRMVWEDMQQVMDRLDGEE